MRVSEQAFKEELRKKDSEIKRTAFESETQHLKIKELEKEKLAMVEKMS